MKILMIAPEPCFEPRGTPFSVFHRCTALGKLGHTVDLVTYHLGEEKNILNVNIHRIPKVPFINHIKIGPSFTKIPLDFFVFFKTLILAMKNNYDCVHAHEEAALMGCFIKILFKIPFVYDMHSSIPQQLSNFNFTHNKYLIGIAQYFENFIIQHSDAVIVICPHLEQTIHSIDEQKYIQLIENTPLSDSYCVVSQDAVKLLRCQLHLENVSVILYTGTLESYQGIDLLLSCIPLVLEKYPSTKFVLIGGEHLQINSFKNLAKSIHIENHVLFIGQRPSDEMPLYMEMADVLVSPRNTGTNTPLKIYSYMKSGKPIVATNLLTHTQVLDNQVAVLADPESQSFADGIIQVLSNRQFAETLGRNARNLADSKYSYDAFLAKTEKIYNYLSSLRRTC